MQQSLFWSACASACPAMHGNFVYSSGCYLAWLTADSGAHAPCTRLAPPSTVIWLTCDLQMVHERTRCECRKSWAMIAQHWRPSWQQMQS